MANSTSLSFECFRLVADCTVYDQDVLVVDRMIRDLEPETHMKVVCQEFASE